jgi:ATP-dependent phosphoenolpyruvate carboxykinase
VATATTTAKGALNNYVTASQGRVESTKNLTPAQLDALLGDVLGLLDHANTYEWDANINGVVVRLTTNSLHQYQFWMANWWPAPNDDSVLPHGRIFSVMGVPGEAPHAYYCPDRHTAVFVNTEYYGQCKSWALGLAAHFLEQRYNTHSIHGACAEVDGKGVVIIAPTGTGKTTQVNKLFQHPKGRVIGDDWIYIQHPWKIDEIASPILEVTQPERTLYVRTENAHEEEWLRSIFDRCMLENVLEQPGRCEHKPGEACAFDEGDSKCYWGFGNSRAMLPREWMAGPEKVGDTATMKLMVLLRRDKESPAEVSLDPDAAIQILKEGKTLIRPGAGPKEKWGTYGYEPWYNPYLLVPDHARQEKFFRDEMRAARVVIINTGAPGESIERTYQRILANLEKA